MSGVHDLVARQILALSAQGFNPPAIAGELVVDEAVVRSVLSVNGAGAKEDRDIDDAQLKRLRAHAFDLATMANDEGVQAKLTMFLLERDKPAKLPTQSTGINPVQINIAIQQANDKMAQLLQAHSIPVNG